MWTHQGKKTCCVYSSGLPGFTETTHKELDGTTVSTLELRRDAPLSTMHGSRLQFRVYSPDGSIFFGEALPARIFAERDSAMQSGSDRQDFHLDLISVYQGFPAVAHLSPSDDLVLDAVFVFHKPQNEITRRIYCYKKRGGGDRKDREYINLDSSVVVNRTTTETGDLHVSLSLTVSGSSPTDEGLYKCEAGYSLVISTLVLLESSTTFLPPDHDYIDMQVALVLRDGYAKQGAPNAITCMRISSVPGLPTLSLNGTQIQLEPSDMILEGAENYYQQWIIYNIPSMDPDTSGNYTCGSENGSASKSEMVVAITEEEYVELHGLDK